MFRALGLVTFFCALGLTLRAQALIELKGGYSQHTVSPGALNDSFTGYPKIEKLDSISADVTANVPLLPIGMGIRYETISKTETAGTLSSKVDWKRTSILVNKRYIDTLMYFGPIATVSIASDFKYTSDNGTATDFKTDNTMTATLGLEAGAKITLLRIGVEAGYLYAPLGELKTSTGTTVTDAGGAAVKVDMSGIYYRAVIGFGF